MQALVSLLLSYSSHCSVTMFSCIENQEYKTFDVNSTLKLFNGIYICIESVI